MTVVIDAAPLVAVADRRDRLRAAVELVLREEPGELVVPAPLTAEVDYLLGRRLGGAARLGFIEDLAAGRFVVAHLDLTTIVSSRSSNAGTRASTRTSLTSV